MAQSVLGPAVFLVIYLNGFMTFSALGSAGFILVATIRTAGPKQYRLAIFIFKKKVIALRRNRYTPKLPLFTGYRVGIVIFDFKDRPWYSVRIECREAI